MGRFIPNENSWVGWATTRPASLAAPTDAEIAAAREITDKVAGVNPTSQGNTLPTPTLKKRFDASIAGTASGSFTGDFYLDQDVANDLTYKAFKRGQRGYLYISRGGGSGTGKIPIAGDEIEVWPIDVSARVPSGLTSNTVQMFQVTGAVFEAPEEEAIVAAASGVPTAPLNFLLSTPASGVAVLDWDLPEFVGAGITGYKVFTGASKAAVEAQATAVTAGTSANQVQFAGTTGRITGITPGTVWFQVLATNAAGDGPRTAAKSITV